MSARQLFITLSNGMKIPVIGFGTYQSTDPVILSAAVKTAINAGYRHIDTAYLYDNEAIIGRVLKELFDSGVVKREDLFITTKLWSTCHRPERVMASLKKQLAWLHLDYVDLYLLHNPRSFQYSETSHFPLDEHGNQLLDFGTKLEETWSCIEDCLRAGLTKAIGVSNTNQSQLERLMKSGTIKPVMNQIESHPYFANRELMDFCRANQIAVTAYGPFGGGRIPNLLDDPCLVEIAKKYNKSAAQVCVRFQLQRGNVVIPKSNTPSRIAENFDVWDFELSEEDMAKLYKLDKNMRVYTGGFPQSAKHPEFPYTELLNQLPH